jgi:hypothetical protein
MNLVYAEPGNAAFVEGKRRFILGAPRYVWIASILFAAPWVIAGYGIIPLMPQPFDGTIIPIVLLLGVPPVIALRLPVRKAWQSFHYSQRGKLLDGELLQVKGSPADSSGYVALFIYKFVTPSGCELSGMYASRRDDLHYRPLPDVGSPVKVLYIDDQHHRML